MIEVAIAIIVVIGIVSIVVFAIYNSIVSDKEEKLALIEARSKERLALIDKGMDPSLADVNMKRISRIPYNALLWGLLLGGFSLGLFVGYIIVKMFGGNMGFIAHAMGMLFGGIGLIVYYLIRKKSDGK
ncbi:MAG: hypothetical protein QM737_23340 [Ferruginibacter sp.]